MLERYFVSPRTTDRIRALWLGPATERYVRWLDEQHAATATIKRHVQTLAHFNNFAIAAGVSTWDALPALIERFVDQRMRETGKQRSTWRNQKALHSYGRVPIEQMLRVILPGFRETIRRAPLPFQETAPGFFTHLGEERGLRRATIYRYTHHLRVFEAYLEKNNVRHLTDLTPALISRFLIERSKLLHATGVSGCASTLRTFLRYLHRQSLLPTNLSRAVTQGRRYRQATIPRAIPWADVAHVLDCVDRRSAIGKRDYALLLLIVSYGLKETANTLQQLLAERHTNLPSTAVFTSVAGRR